MMYHIIWLYNLECIIQMYLNWKNPAWENNASCIILRNETITKLTYAFDVAILFMCSATKGSSSDSCVIGKFSTHMHYWLVFLPRSHYFFLPQSIINKFNGYIIHVQKTLHQFFSLLCPVWMVIFSSGFSLSPFLLLTIVIVYCIILNSLWLTG